MRARLFLALLLACSLTWATPATPEGVVVDAQAEVAAALFSASATQAAAEKAADARINAQRAMIVRLAAQVHAGEAQRSQLVSAEKAFVDELAEKDRAYAAAIAVFRGAVTDIAATPDGAQALARFNAGDEVGALAILDRMREADDRARKTQSDIASAAEGRRIAQLALEARARGKVDMAAVIARYEDVTRLDPGVFFDWVQLDRLYREANRLADARAAAEMAAKVATNDRDRGIALNELGDVDKDQGDLSSALDAYRKALQITRALLAANPVDGDLQRDVSVSLVKIGDVLRTQKNLAGALAAQSESLAIARALAAANPGKPVLQRDIVLRLDRVGDVLSDQGDLPNAQKDFQESLDISRRLAAADPSDADLKRGLSISLDRMGKVLADEGDVGGALNAYEESLAIARGLAAADRGNARLQGYVAAAMWRLAEMKGAPVRWTDVADQLEGMRQKGMLPPAGQAMLDEASRRAALEAAK
jgi:tetratricopeptide (TPR) repeat protein